jgi:hypothetical protein
MIILNKMPRRQGWVVIMDDAVGWGVAWAIVAVIAGTGLLIAAMTLVRHALVRDYDFAAGYNALEPVTDR